MNEQTMNMAKLFNLTNNYKYSGPSSSIAGNRQRGFLTQTGTFSNLWISAHADLPPTNAPTLSKSFKVGSETALSVNPSEILQQNEWLFLEFPIIILIFFLSVL